MFTWIYKKIIKPVIKKTWTALDNINVLWGAITTGPAVWGTFSMVGATGLFLLQPSSPAYFIAVLLSASCGVSCCVISGMKIWAANLKETLLQQQIQRLNQRLDTLESQTNRTTFNLDLSEADYRSDEAARSTIEPEPSNTSSSCLSKFFRAKSGEQKRLSLQHARNYQTRSPGLTTI